MKCQIVGFRSGGSGEAITPRVSVAEAKDRKRETQSSVEWNKRGNLGETVL